MSKNVLIVESPAKAKTIENYLGKEYVVKSSYGHVRDLVKGKMGIDIEDDFAPQYAVLEDKKKVINDLKKSIQRAQHVYLATDDDREGEAISWHLSQVLPLPAQTTQRIVFREITRQAIQKALQHPRKINADLVHAQQARRILDRIVGFEVSPILWKKIRSGLSAGRVQSVAVRLLVERERERQRFQAMSFMNVGAFFTHKEHSIQTQLSKRLENEEDARMFLSACIDHRFCVKEKTTKRVKRHPSPPFTTSTLQQEAHRLLGFSVGYTMRLAQQLYEGGHISYMRTDSTHLSQESRTQAAKQISAEFGEKYLYPRQYQTRNKTAQEAHEAIRPTQFSLAQAPVSAPLQRLYSLIYQRALSSQMASTIADLTTIEITTPREKVFFVAKGEVIVFDGFLKLYEAKQKASKEDEQRLPDLQEGTALSWTEMRAKQGFQQPPPRYSEASLVKELEEKGIGRPFYLRADHRDDTEKGICGEGKPRGQKKNGHLLALKG